MSGNGVNNLATTNLSGADYNYLAALQAQSNNNRIYAVTGIASNASFINQSGLGALGTESKVTYTGKLNGRAQLGEGVDLTNRSDISGDYSGNITLIADFSNAASSVITGTLAPQTGTNADLRNLKGFRSQSATLFTLENGKITDNGFTANLGVASGRDIDTLFRSIVTDDNHPNQISGTFYGDKAQEVGGTFNFTTGHLTSTSAIYLHTGTFYAKR